MGRIVGRRTDLTFTAFSSPQRVTQLSGGQELTSQSLCRTIRRGEPVQDSTRPTATFLHLHAPRCLKANRPYLGWPEHPPPHHPHHLLRSPRSILFSYLTCLPTDRSTYLSHATRVTLDLQRVLTTTVIMKYIYYSEEGQHLKCDLHEQRSHLPLQRNKMGWSVFMTTEPRVIQDFRHAWSLGRFKHQDLSKQRKQRRCVNPRA